mgnify:CR=1 FL=1
MRKMATSLILFMFLIAGCGGTTTTRTGSAAAMGAAAGGAIGSLYGEFGKGAAIGAGAAAVPGFILEAGVARGILCTRDDHLCRRENAVAGTPVPEEGNHLVAFDVSDECVDEDGLEARTDLEPYGLCLRVDDQQQATLLAAVIADAAFTKLPVGKVVDIAGLACRQDAVVDIVILQQEGMKRLERDAFAVIEDAGGVDDEAVAFSEAFVE